MGPVRIIVCLFVGIISVSADYSMYECPLGWEESGEYCYRFVQEELNLVDAKAACTMFGELVFVLTINSDMEHTYIYDQLNTKYDTGSRKRDWWTSGRRVPRDDGEGMSFYWEGDGKPIESYFYWHNNSIPADMSKDKIIYNYNGFQWGWILGINTDKHPFICKISKEDIYHISDTRRGPEYGWEGTDPSMVPRGPKIIEEPIDTLFGMSVIDLPEEGQTLYASFACLADGYPAPIYSWYKQRTETEELIDPALDERYTLVGGRLVIHQASQEKGDNAFYWCKAENEFGAALSTRAQLEFGFIGDFARDPRSPVNANMHKEAIIDCDPPDVSPDDSPITFEWYKGLDYVRTDVKSYIFNSWDGKLYFSQVTNEDIGLYKCKVSRPGFITSSGALGQETKLNVAQTSPGIFEPSILSGFPRVYPADTKVGDNIRIECFAAGTSDPPLMYSWKRIRKTNTTETEIPMPLGSSLDDHNRVLLIPRIQIYDEGYYRCIVRRLHGGEDSGEVWLMLSAKPYFTMRLEDQFIDVQSDLRWKCGAEGIPSIRYMWRKNGEQITNSSDSIQISQNVLIIKGADAKMHNGIYQCEARNSIGLAYSTGELRIIEFAPTFSKMPLQVNQFATEEGNSTIICRPEAAPRPEITWFKNGALLVSNERVKMMPNGNLFISPIRKEDSGTYTCRAENKLGKAESTGNFTVLDTVTITMPPKTPINGFQVNHTNILHCIASYNPQLDITYVWHQGDKMIEFEKVYRLGENKYQVWRDPHFKRGSGHYLGALYLMNAQYSHNGKYKCTVEDTNGGKMSATVDVIVLGPPYEPAGVAKNLVTTTTVNIQFMSAGDNGAQITSYLIETYNGWEGFWRIHDTNVPAEVGNEETNHIQHHLVTGLRPYSLYKIRVRAENDYGTSDPSLPTEEFTTGSVVPDLYPEQIGGGGGKTGELVIRWRAMREWERNGDNFHYIVYYKNEGDKEFGERKVNVSGNAVKVSILVGEKNYYMPYDVAVQAFNIMGAGPMSPQVTIRSAMRMPDIIAENMQIQPYNSTACIVSWIPVDDADRTKIGGALGGYRVAYWDRQKYGDEVIEDATRVTVNGQASEAMVIGLEPDTEYMFGVYVWNEAGNGPITDPYRQRTLRQAPINQPVEVKVYQIDQETIKATWRGVSTTNLEEPLTGYKVRIWREGSAIKIADDYNAKKEVELVVSGLNSQIYYKLRVFGYSRGGDGTMSSPAVHFHLGAAGHIQASMLTVLLIAVLCVLRTYL